MAKIEIPYGRSHISVDVPPARLAGVLMSHVHGQQPPAPESEQVRLALENPIGSPRLKDLAVGKKKIVIITSDHTRAVPTKIIAPLMLAEIRAGNPDADITYLVATGFHRLTTQAELEQKFGAKLLSEVKVVVHDSADNSQLVKVGKLPSGGELIINKLAMEADLVCAEGFIEPHLMAGFSGGRKSVLPGIVSRTTVMANHCSEFVAHDRARSGVLDGNPIHIDMVYAAQQAKLTFIVNVLLNEKQKVIKAVAGDLVQAHLAGCNFLRGLAAVEAKPADIVITTNGGYPLDQNVYQHVKALSSAEATCKKGGVIIACAELSDGHGSEDVYTWLKGGAKPAMDKIMATPRNSTVPDQWSTQILARILLKHTVIFVTEPKVHAMVKDMGFKAAATIEEAMKMAEAIVGANAKVTVIPDGVAVIVTEPELAHA